MLPWFMYPFDIWSYICYSCYIQVGKIGITGSTIIYNIWISLIKHFLYSIILHYGLLIYFWDCKSHFYYTIFFYGWVNQTKPSLSHDLKSGLHFLILSIKTRYKSDSFVRLRYTRHIYKPYQERQHSRCDIFLYDGEYLHTSYLLKLIFKWDIQNTLCLAYLISRKIPNIGHIMLS